MAATQKCWGAFYDAQAVSAFIKPRDFALKQYPSASEALNFFILSFGVNSSTNHCHKIIRLNQYCVHGSDYTMKALWIIELGVWPPGSQWNVEKVDKRISQ